MPTSSQGPDVDAEGDVEQQEHGSPMPLRKVPDFLDPELPAEQRPPRCRLLWAVELEEAVLALALSPKQKVLAVATVEDEIPLLEVDQGQARWRLSGHDGGVNGVVFLGGNTLVSAGEDGRCRVWSIAKQASTSDLVVDAVGADKGPSGHSVSHIAAAPGGTLFAAAAGSQVTLFTAGQGAGQPPARRVLPALPGTVESLKFDGSGNLLVSYYGGLTYWDLSRTEEEGQALDLPYPANALAADVSPDGSWFVVGAHDQTVHIFHLIQGGPDGVRIEEMTCGGYETKVTSVRFSPSGRWMASAGGDKGMVWDFRGGPAGSVPTATVGHTAPISCVAWQPDGSLLATGGKDGVVCIYEVDHALQGRPKVCLPGAMAADAAGDEITSLLWADDGVLYSGHCSGYVRKWSLPLSDD